MMRFEDIAFQLVDLPPLNDEHVEPWVFDIVRRADLLWIVVAVENAVDGLELTRRILAAKGIDPRWSITRSSSRRGSTAKAAKKTSRSWTSSSSIAGR